MSHTRLYVAAAIIASAVILSFILSVPQTAYGPVGERPSTVDTSGDVPVRIDRTYTKGVHTFTGSILAPNACARVTAEALLVSDPKDVVRLSLILVNDGEVCLQVPTEVPFSATVTAPEDVSVSVTLNGKPIVLPAES